jgi:hypothetical protein
MEHSIDREKVIKDLDELYRLIYQSNVDGEILGSLHDALALLKEQEAVVHPEPSCEMTYITDCCCDLCGVQLIREDNFCRGCGKRIEWEGR